MCLRGAVISLSSLTPVIGFTVMELLKYLDRDLIS